MGDCIRKESLPSPLRKAKIVNFKDELLLMGESNEDCIHSSVSLTKELMGKADVQDISVHQLLKQLMNVTEGLELRHRSWRPALQSIPEVN
ncbi:hypothetical protein R3W88_032236 [Solanum pinnatisectum]|uniref:Uncharacterized protein n=1 Tax=Solanum pinnatisectum TaxID=50273 RepID=A0AAV9LQH3_9SOLN|nr:hypothetical protein R3W88_032236 [Solanum pinnatisectum]